MKARYVLPLVLSGSLCVPALIGTHTAPASVRKVASNVLFDDEFDGTAGSSPSSDWLQLTGYGPLLGPSDETNTSSRENSYLDGAGHLVIAAQRTTSNGQTKYTSAWLETAASFGPVMHVEARMKIAGGLGTWPLFWLLGGDPYGLSWPRQGEIDVGEEIGREPTSFIATLHGETTNPAHYKRAYGKEEHEWESSTHVDTHQVLSDAFHTYATDITPTQVSWSLDGRVVKVFKKSQLGDGDVWSFTYPMHVIVNLSIGGAFPGEVPASTPFPQRTIVDWVRVTNDPAAPAGPTPDPAGARAPSCDPTSHGLVQVTLKRAKGGTSKGGTVVLKRHGKVVQKKTFAFPAAVRFCAKPGAVQLIAGTTKGTQTRALTVQAQNTSRVAFTLR